jgi:hypothetical protein
MLKTHSFSKGTSASFLNASHSSQLSQLDKLIQLAQLSMARINRRFQTLIQERIPDVAATCQWPQLLAVLQDMEAALQASWTNVYKPKLLQFDAVPAHAATLQEKVLIMANLQKFFAVFEQEMLVKQLKLEQNIIAALQTILQQEVLGKAIPDFRQNQAGFHITPESITGIYVTTKKLMHDADNALNKLNKAKPGELQNRANQLMNRMQVLHETIHSYVRQFAQNNNRCDKSSKCEEGDGKVLSFLKSASWVVDKVPPNAPAEKGCLLLSGILSDEEVVVLREELQKMKFGEEVSRKYG